MKTIHLIGAGGVAGIGFARCIKNAGYNVQGHDSSPWAEQMMECDGEVTPMLNCDMVVPVPDAAVLKYADCDLSYLPPRHVIELCQDKGEFAKRIGDLAPKLLWIRDTHGAGGKGAQMASEYLPGRNISVESVFWQGRYCHSFMKERLSYRTNMVDHNVNGIGSSAVSKCIWDKEYYDVAQEAIDRVVKKRKDKHGVFGVDLRGDENGKPKVTEINAGRFMTASYAFFTRYNLPLFFCRQFLHDDVQGSLGGEYPLGYVAIRQTGSLPKLVHDSEIIYPKGWGE